VRRSVIVRLRPNAVGGVRITRIRLILRLYVNGLSFCVAIVVIALLIRHGTATSWSLAGMSHANAKLHTVEMAAPTSDGTSSPAGPLKIHAMMIPMAPPSAPACTLR
jgi:hypothetical protein